jgi:hypothetical protein
MTDYGSPDRCIFLKLTDLRLNKDPQSAPNPVFRGPKVNRSPRSEKFVGVKGLSVKEVPDNIQ